MGIEKTKDGILKFRHRKRLNQTELAKILGILPQNVSKWESGKNNFPSFKAAEQLLEMGITVEELFGIEYNKMHNLGVQEASPASYSEKLKKFNDFEADLLRKMLDEFADFDGELESIKNLKEVYKLEREIERGDNTIDLAAKKMRLKELQEQIEDEILFSNIFSTREQIKLLEKDLEIMEETDRLNSYEKPISRQRIQDLQQQIEKEMYSYVNKELMQLEKQESTSKKIRKWILERNIRNLQERDKQLVDDSVGNKISLNRFNKNAIKQQIEKLEEELAGLEGG